MPRMPGAHACVVTRVNYPADRVHVLLMSPASCACTITTGIITAAGNIAPLFLLFFSLLSNTPNRRRRLPGNSAWFTGIGRRESTQASVACPSALHARIRLLTHPTRALIPRQLSDFRTEFPRSTSRGGKPGEVGSSPDRIMTDQGAKTYHLYLPSTNHSRDHHFRESHYFEVARAL